MDISQDIGVHTRLVVKVFRIADVDWSVGTMDGRIVVDFILAGYIFRVDRSVRFALSTSLTLAKVVDLAFRLDLKLLHLLEVWQ